MSNENSLKHLGEWCNEYRKRSNINIHPSSIPTDLVLEDILSHISYMDSRFEILAGQIKILQEKMDDAKKEQRRSKVKFKEQE